MMPDHINIYLKKPNILTTTLKSAREKNKLYDY